MKEKNPFKREQSKKAKKSRQTKLRKNPIRNVQNLYEEKLLKCYKFFKSHKFLKARQMIS